MNNARLMANSSKPLGPFISFALVLFPLSHLCAYALSNFLLAILSIYCLWTIYRDPREVSAFFEGPFQRMAKLLTFLLLWTLVSVVLSFLFPPFSPLDYRFSRWFHKPLRALLIAWLLLRRRGDLASWIFQTVVAVSIALSLIPLAQYPLSKIGKTRLSIDYPSGAPLLGISETSCIAAFLAIAALCLALYSQQGRMYRLAWAAGSLLALTVIAATGSRSASAATFAGGMLLFAESIYRQWREQRSKCIGYIAVGALCLIVLAASFVHLNPRFFDKDNLATSGGFRLLAWREGMKCALARPIRGYGAIRLSYVYRAFGPVKGPPPHDVIAPNEAHCDYITWLLVAGIPALAVYPLFMILSITTLLRISRKSEGIGSAILLATACGVFSCLVYGCSSSFCWNNKSAPFVLFLLGLALALAKHYYSEGKVCCAKKV